MSETTRPQYEPMGHTELASLCHHRDAEIERLRAALRPFVYAVELRALDITGELSHAEVRVTSDEYKRARAVLKGSDDVDLA